MKTNKPHILLLLALTAVFTCCSGDDYSDINTTGSNNGAPFTITVTDGGYASLSGGASTRASEDGYKTIFTEGDKIGVFAVKGSKIVNEVNNLCLTATNTPDFTWVDAKGKPLADVKGATYYAYYPYQENLKGEFTSVSDSDTAEEFFANVISNWSPNSDQSTYNKYTAQDLMIAKGTMSPNAKSLSFSMKHQMALVVIDLPRIEYEFINTIPTILNYITYVPNVIFDEFKPYRMEDGTYRYLVKPSTQDALLSGSYTSALGSTAWEVNTKNIAAGKYQIFEGGDGSSKPIKMTHELKIGDFFMKDGTLISGEKSLTTDQKAACIGIVFWVGDATAKDKTLKNDHPNCTHGLVVALNDVEKEKISWQNPSSSVQDWLDANQKEKYLPVRSAYGLTDPVNNIQGYNNTKAIEAFNAANPNNIVIAVEKVGNYRKRILAPITSSDWYLPSVKELGILCGGEKDINYANQIFGTVNKELINGKIDLIGNNATRIPSELYWGSTNSLGDVFNVFNIGCSEGRVTVSPSISKYWVRCVLAF